MIVLFWKFIWRVSVNFGFWQFPPLSLCWLDWIPNFARCHSCLIIKLSFHLQNVVCMLFIVNLNSWLELNFNLIHPHWKTRRNVNLECFKTRACRLQCFIGDQNEMFAQERFSFHSIAVVQLFSARNLNDPLCFFMKAKTQTEPLSNWFLFIHINLIWENNCRFLPENLNV